MDLLLIEDNEQLAYGLQLNLEVEGFKIRRAHNGTEGMRLLSEYSPDLIILDLMLPDMRGFDVLKQVREAGSRIPIVVLSALTDETDRVLALRLGADDYVSKPFGLMELIERIKLRIETRGPVREVGELRVGPIRLCKSAERLFIDDSEVSLRPKEFAVLCLLMEARGAVLSKEELLRRIWGRIDDVRTRTVDQHVRQLRQKFGAFGFAEVIRIIPTRGFAFSLESISPPLS